jgi:DNA-binding transcriptional LysR family regulator
LLESVTIVTDMDVTILKTFIEVHRTCHFGKAADNLFVTQSTVSARIRQLETELGVELFKRNRNNIQLTTAGQKFLKHAESILNVWNRACLDINIQEEGKTPFVIGAVPSLWDVYLGNLIMRLRSQYPDMAIVAEASSSESLVRALLGQSIDVAFMYDYPQIPDLEIKDAMSFELIMVSSEKKQTVRDAFTKNYIYVDWGSSFLREHARHFPDSPALDLRINLGHTAHYLIKKEGGSAYLPEPMVREDLSRKSLYRVEDAPGINRKSFAVYRQNENQDFVVELLSLINPQV